MPINSLASFTPPTIPNQDEAEAAAQSANDASASPSGECDSAAPSGAQAAASGPPIAPVDKAGAHSGGQQGGAQEHGGADSGSSLASLRYRAGIDSTMVSAKLADAIQARPQTNARTHAQTNAQTQQAKSQTQPQAQAKPQTKSQPQAKPQAPAARAQAHSAPTPTTTSSEQDDESSRASDQQHYDDNIYNATNPFSAIGYTWLRALNNAGHDIIDGAKGLRTLATSSDARSRLASTVGNALAHPVDTATNLYKAGKDYAHNTTFEQKAEDALRLTAGGLATAGLGKVAVGAGRVALASEAASKMAAATGKAAAATGKAVGKVVGKTAEKVSAGARQVQSKAGAGDVAKGGIVETGSATNGIYTSMRPMETEFPQLKGVNPHYVEGARPGVNTNCVSCVNAAQARLTGADPAAVASPSTGYADQNALRPSAPLGFQDETSVAAVIQQMTAEGDGAVGVVLIHQSGPIKHVINVVNKGGKVYFIDAQIGKIVTLKPNLTVELGRPL